MSQNTLWSKVIILTDQVTGQRAAIVTGPTRPPQVIIQKISADIRRMLEEDHRDPNIRRALALLLSAL